MLGALRAGERVMDCRVAGLLGMADEEGGSETAPYAWGVGARGAARAF